MTWLIQLLKNVRRPYVTPSADRNCYGYPIAVSELPPRARR